MTWVEGIDRDFVERRFGNDVLAALMQSRVYSDPPVIDGGRLVATVVPVVNERLSTPIKVAVRVVKEVIDIACACRRGRMCDHVVWLLVDVAYHPALKAALVKGEPTEALLADLPRIWAAAVEERTLEHRLAAWLPPRKFDDDLEISITITKAQNRPAVVLEHRRASTRAAVSGRDILEARLLPRRRQLVELTSPYHADRDQLVATRGQASLLIHLLREEIGLSTDRFKARVRYSDDEVTLRAEADGERLVARWLTSTATVDASDAMLFAGVYPYLWVPSTRTFHRVAPSVDLDAAQGMQTIGSLPLGVEVGRALLVRGRGLGVALPAPETFGLPPMVAPSFELRLEGLPLEVKAELVAVYGTVKVPITPEPATETFRDLGAEEHALALLADAGFDERLVAEGDGAIRLWTDGLARIRSSTDPRFELFGNTSLLGIKIAPPIEVSVRVEGSAGWLDVEMEFRAGALKVEIDRMHRALAASKRWVALSDGTLAKIADEVALLVEDVGDLPEPLRLPTHQLGRIDRWRDLVEVDLDPAAEALRQKANAPLPPEPFLPSGLRAILRAYQRAGVAWLQRLQSIGAGGLLADDMGLGKTLMTLAFLARWKEDEGSAPSIVVCPTSLVTNWAREAERFTPDLRVLVWTGRERRDVDIASWDLVVTTYGLLRREQDLLSRTPFRAAILDEAQNIKNASAETTQAARRLDARMRIALTGTPVENRLAELWSLLSFANPGILGDERTFDRRYARPIMLRPDGDVAADLRATVRPFILRRTKAQVLPDLPPKIEVERACIFGMRQRRLYDGLAVALRQSVSDSPKRRIEVSVLTAILRLRQMSCDPRLVDPSATAADSAKRTMFLELIRELVSEERRALVFSQFVELLHLWREDLDRAKVAYEYLDGSTVDRAAIVDRFQNGKAPLFLISLKAGGAGLNLTAADTVIHCDPWWNPAAEDQATDRAHRIGQTKAVTVIRLVAKGSIEDKIALLKKAKRDVADAIIEAAPLTAGALTDEDVATLLGDAEGDAADD